MIAVTEKRVACTLCLVVERQVERKQCSENIPLYLNGIYMYYANDYDCYAPSWAVSYNVRSSPFKYSDNLLMKEEVKLKWTEVGKSESARSPLVPV